ncbi:MAG TPA: hypothetical protein VKD72_27400 [Gemmataceae bacterium]|nr:hypothetical protein [Gemmataceae bacterium]
MTGGAWTKEALKVVPVGGGYRYVYRTHVLLHQHAVVGRPVDHRHAHRKQCAWRLCKCLPWCVTGSTGHAIWFVLVTGCCWENRSATMGCSSRTAHHRLQPWEGLGASDRLHADLLRVLWQANKLDPDLVAIDGVMARAFGGGEQTSPIDRLKKGSKHTAGGPARNAAGHRHGQGQHQRPHPGHSAGAGLPRDRRQDWCAP